MEPLCAIVWLVAGFASLMTGSYLLSGLPGLLIAFGIVAMVSPLVDYFMQWVRR